MNNLLQNEDEIREAILSKLEELQSFRIATINKRCYDEAMMDKVLKDMRLQNLIDYDQNFIWRKS